MDRIELAKATSGDQKGETKMNSLARHFVLGAFVVMSGLSAANGTFAQSAMSATPMAPAAGAMTADPMATNPAMEECHTKARAETDAAKMKTMMDACDAMAPNAMATPMAPDAMAKPATK